MRLFMQFFEVAIDIDDFFSINAVNDEVVILIFFGKGRNWLQEDELEVHTDIALMLLDELLCKFKHLVVDQLISSHLKQDDCPAFNEQFLYVIVEIPHVFDPLLILPEKMAGGHHIGHLSIFSIDHLRKSLREETSSHEGRQWHSFLHNPGESTKHLNYKIIAILIVINIQHQNANNSIKKTKPLKNSHKIMPKTTSKGPFKQINYNLILMSVPNSFNPSDYQYLLKSLMEGNMIAKSQSLKRFNTLVINDKKQFGVYAKRIVLALQDLMFEQKEDINLLAAMLVLEIINLNPKDIQYYIRTKLLKQIVVNLGDVKPNLRKTSHYCILAFVKTFKHLDQIINFYIDHGIGSPEPQLRQKCINSFQSIAITESKYLNWTSPEFKKLFQLLLQKLKDDNPYVQKAAEQCLLTLSRMDQVKVFIKKLNPTFYSLYKLFYESQLQLGNLTEIKIQSNEKMVNSQKSLLNVTPAESNKTAENKSHQSHPSHPNVEKMGFHRQDSLNKQAIIDRIEEIRRNAQTPKTEEPHLSKMLSKKSESLSIKNEPKERERMLPPFSNREDKRAQLEKQVKQRQKIAEHPVRLIHSILSIPVVPPSPPKAQKVENVFGKKVLEDLKNQKDWKTRLEAIEQLQSKFEMYKESFELESLMKIFVPILIKLLADPNFKIAFISLKIIQEILKIPKIKLEVIVPQVLEKLNDSKIALRQNVSKLIRSQYLNSNNRIWIDCLMDQLKKNTYSSFREEVLNILSKLYDQRVLDYSYEKIIEEICPLMDDAKTKIKIRTLDLLVTITIKTQKIDNIKSLLMNKLNQVYYEMFIEKVSKETKAQRATPNEERERQSKSVAFPSLKKSKTSANNTTSSSLQKYSKTIDTKPLSRASSFLQKNTVSLVRQKKTESLIRQQKIENLEILSTRNLNKDQENLSDVERTNFTPPQNVRKRPLNYKKKLQRTLQSKITTNYTTDNEGLRPLSDPEKELKDILTDIKSDDWQTSNDSLTKLRRIILYHSEFLNIVVVKSLAGDIMKHVESLRSSLSKNAVITINQLSNAMKKGLDSELDTIFNKLIKKTLDTNSFISEQVKKALISVSSNSNESKVVTLLHNFHTSRSLPIKQNIIYIIETVIQINKFYEKQLERIVQILVNFMGQGALQIREKTKAILNSIIERQRSNSKIYKLIPLDILDKLKKRDSIISLERNQSIQSSSPKKEKQSEIIEIPSPSPKKKKKIINFPEEFNQLQELTKKCEGGEWKLRLDSLTKMVAIAKSFPEEITQHKMGVRIMDIISKQINDPNSKVSTNALQLFKEITPQIPRLIEANLSVIVNQIFNCFASQKNQIRESSLQLFDLIIDNTERWMLIQHLCNGALYGPTRSKASILVKILKILPDSFREKKSIIARNVYSMINKVVQEGKSQILPILKEIVIICLNLGGDDALSALKQQAKSLAE